MPRRASIWLLLFAGWTLLGVFFATQTYLGAMYAGRPLTWAQAVSIALVAWYVRAAGAPLAVWLALRFPFRGRRWLRALAVHLPASLLVAVAEQMLYAILVQRLSWVPQRAAGNFELHMNVLIWWVVVAATHGVDYYHRFRERELASSRLQAELVGARLDALRAQLQPHFLFNTLNAISELMHEDVEQADLMLNELSQLLRVLLQHAAQPHAPLREELAFLEHYCNLQRMRFSDRLTFHFDIAPESLDVPVPCLLLQPLVENAVVHGVAPNPQAGRVEVRARIEDGWLLLEVRDNGAGPSAGAAQEGVGLRNTRLRLEHAYGPGHEFELAAAPAGGTRVRLRLPLRIAALEPVGEVAP